MLTITLMLIEKVFQATVSNPWNITDLENLKFGMFGHFMFAIVPVFHLLLLGNLCETEASDFFDSNR